MPKLQTNTIPNRSKGSPDGVIYVTPGGGGEDAGAEPGSKRTRRTTVRQRIALGRPGTAGAATAQDVCCAVGNAAAAAAGDGAWDGDEHGDSTSPRHARSSSCSAGQRLGMCRKLPMWITCPAKARALMTQSSQTKLPKPISCWPLTYVFR